MNLPAQINQMNDEDRAKLEKEIARKLALRVAGFVFFKIAATRVLTVLANRAYQASVTEH